MCACVLACVGACVNASMCVCVCVRACVRACVCNCLPECHLNIPTYVCGLLYLQSWSDFSAACFSCRRLLHPPLHTKVVCLYWDCSYCSRICGL